MSFRDCRLSLSIPLLVLLVGCRSNNDPLDFPRDHNPSAVAPVTPKVGNTPIEPVREEDEAYASIRIVRRDSGLRGRPNITLPEGYHLYDRQNYGVASPSEYYVFIGGPKATAKDVKIEWPFQDIFAVIYNDQHLEMRKEGTLGSTVYVDVPLQANSLRAAWPTLEIFSHLNEPDLPIRIEHNDESRRSGDYARVPWVDGQTKAVLNYIFATRQILRDWGIHHELMRDKAGGLALMGFETNNPLHGDFPPHFHFIYYFPDANGRPSSSAPGSQIPHFYLDSAGRIYENKLDVFGATPQSTRLKPGEPMLYIDPSGQVRLAVEIRPDGGLNIGPAPGQYRYAILNGDDGDDFRTSVRVFKDDKPWIRVGVTDDTEQGSLEVRIRPLGNDGEPATEIYPYDPLTGALKTQPKK